MTNNTKPCRVPGCLKRGKYHIRSRGLCEKHKRRWLKNQSFIRKWDADSELIGKVCPHCDHYKAHNKFPAPNNPLCITCQNALIIEHPTDHNLRGRPKGDNWYERGHYRKIGAHGFEYYYNGDEWIRSKEVDPKRHYLNHVYGGY